MHVLDGDLVVQPPVWMLVFNREASNWWLGRLVFGRYKHVRAYAYVPFLHVWIFYDPHLGGTDIFVTADGEPAQRVLARWTIKADLIAMRRRSASFRFPPVLGWCVPTIKRLIGLNTGALRPSTLYRHCLKHGGERFEMPDGHPKVQPAPA